MKFFQTIHLFDVQLISRLMNIGNKEVWTKAARIISRTGDAYIYLAYAGWLGYREEYRWFQVMLLAYILERFVYFSAKYGFKRGRPAKAIANFDAYIKPADEYSFPSGHASASFLMVTLLAYIYGPLMLPLFIWPLLVAMSRMMLGLHFPSDLIVGAITGIASVWLANLWILP